MIEIRFPIAKWDGWSPAPAQFLLPIPSGFRGGTLKLRCRVGVLRVENGEAPAFGVPVDSLALVLKPNARGSLEIVEPEGARTRQR